MTDRVCIFDTTLRDGEQAAGVLFSERDKLDIAERLAAMRVDVVEAGFPAASEAELAAVRAVATQIRSTSVCALARCVQADVDAATRALEPAERPRIHVFVNSSDMQLRTQLRKSRAEAVDMAAAAISRASIAVGDVEFSPMDATRADRAYLGMLVRAAIQAGARTINIPDTLGFALPHQVSRLLLALRRDVPELSRVVLSFHGQNDLGMASANAVAAIRAGARQVEVCVNGIGERAGNTSFEEVVMALVLHGKALGVDTAVDATGICALSRLVEERSGLAVSPSKAIVGRNAFRHASGIHQDGVIKERQNFECIDPAQIGHPRGTEIVLGKLSGAAGFASRCRALGYELHEPTASAVLSALQSLADRKRELSDEDVRDACRGALSKAQKSA